ncbi:hypothetical protein ElyMa_002651300 [Elysia marginata]|uniref:UspA domain-containing protein n=1 Tax=Elysia marginata TaxID=1093978 RepID=A0AAV4H6D3_9GAST|nr:hypothetical protein ElyMa_002651300 [Elysia marginata]
MVDNNSIVSQDEPEKVVVVPVEWGQLSKDTFLWYVNTLYLNKHCVHVCYVPDFRRHLQPRMSPEEVMEVMIETSTESEQLKKLYESLIEEKKVNGKFVRVGGNNRWCAIVEYCKRVNAVLVVLGTQPNRCNGGHQEHQNSYSSDLQGLGQAGTSRCDKTDFDGTITKEESLLRMSAESSLREAAYKMFRASLKDQGPFAATVTHDVLDQCECPAVVYRAPEKESGEAQARRGSLVTGSFNAKKNATSNVNGKTATKEK